MSNEPKRLYRSRSERMIAGVCGGLAEYFGIDPTLVRLAFIVALFYGPGPLAYLIMMIVVPEEPYPSQTGGQELDEGSAVEEDEAAE
jgi:phage shock protein C